MKSALADGAGPASSGLVSHWKLDEGRGSRIGDFSGQGNSCVMVEGPTWSPVGAPQPDGTSVQAMRFHGGENERLDCAGSSFLRFGAPLTIAAWFNYAAVPSTTQLLVLLLAEERKLATALGIRSGQIGVWKWGGGLVDATKLPAPGWHHVASTYDGKQHRLYLDGALMALNFMPLDPGPVAEVMIGGQRKRSEPFVGLLDDVRLYDRALTPDEIHELHAGRPQRALFWLAAAVAILTVLLVGQRIRLYHVRGRYEAILNERNRIARELHDTLAQGFTGVSYQMGLLAQQLADVPGPGRTTLAQLRKMLAHVRLGARQLVGDLRSPAMPSPSLRAALEEVARSASVLGNASAGVAVLGDERPLSDDVIRELVRVAQEATANAGAHGKARNISLLVTFAPGQVLLRVEDDGVGFDGMSAASGLTHFGIQGMRERVEQLRGRFTLQSAPGKGAVVEACIPAP